MSLKKAYCPICHPSDEKYHIFDVNADAEVCYCPHCMAKLIPADAIKAYELFINKKINKANNILFSAIDFPKAYSLFAQVLEYDAFNHDALYGRLLSLLYMSTLRHPRFKDFMLLFQEEKETFHKAENRSSYFLFLSRVLHAINEYDVAFRKRITISQYFYDIDCIKLYFSHVKDIYDIKMDIRQEILFLQSKDKECQDYAVSLTFLDKSIKVKDLEMTKRWLTADGYSYGYVGKGEMGDVLLGRSDQQNVVKINHYHPKALYEDKAKGKKLIKDNVFPNNLFTFHVKNVAFPLMIIFAVLTLAMVVMCIIEKDLACFPYILGLTILIFFAGIVCLIAFLVAFRKLARRHRLVK